MTARAGQLVRLLGSDRDGEVLNAVRALDRLLKAQGFDWFWMAGLVERNLLPVGDLQPWQAQARALLASGSDRLSPNVRSFLNTILRLRTRPSVRQQAWLDSL